MKVKQQQLICLLSLLFLAASLNVAAAGETAAEPAEPLPTAIYFYADWCAACQRLSPNFEDAAIGLQSQLRIVIVDYSSTSSTVKSLQRAKDLGLSEHLRASRKTGYVQLVDNQGEKAGQLYSHESASNLRGKLRRLVAASKRDS